MKTKEDKNKEVVYTKEGPLPISRLEEFYIIDRRKGETLDKGMGGC